MDLEYLYNNLVKMTHIKEVRQYGLMIAIEFDFSDDPKLVGKVLNKLRDNNILVLLSGNLGQYIRLLPPLIINKQEIDILLDKLDMILNDI